MKAQKTLLRSLLAASVLAGSALVSPAQAANDYSVYITEWMYKGGSGEFIEFTNTGTQAVDFWGWSYDDDSRNPGVLNLSSFGIVAAGESVIITETSAETFRADWGLDASVKIIGNYSNNIGNGDEINLFDSTGALVDRLTYGSNPRTNGISGRATTADALGANTVSLWTYSSVGDIEGSWRSASGATGSPGTTSFVSPVPEPATYGMMLAGLGLVGFAARRRSQQAR